MYLNLDAAPGSMHPPLGLWESELSHYSEVKPDYGLRFQQLSSPRSRSQEPASPRVMEPWGVIRR